jgi:hypothetical protein
MMQKLAVFSEPSGIGKAPEEACYGARRFSAIKIRVVKTGENHLF